MDTEHDKARAWREAMGFSRAKLAKLSGYSESTIQDLEAGQYRQNGRPIDPDTWLRYRLACAAITADIKFDWLTCKLRVTEERTVLIPIG